MTEMTIPVPISQTGAASSTKELRRVICEEIIPPMTKGLGALEKLLCHHDNTVSFRERTLTGEGMKSMIEVNQEAMESYRTEGNWLEEPELHRSILKGAGSLTDPKSPVELLANIRIFGTCEIAQKQ